MIAVWISSASIRSRNVSRLPRSDVLTRNCSIFSFRLAGRATSIIFGFDRNLSASFLIGGDGWGNHELQAYTDRIDNASVGDGVLTITAHRQDGGANGYTYARLVSTGKGDFLYGRIEARAKLPSGRGPWQARWRMPPGTAQARKSAV